MNKSTLWLGLRIVISMLLVVALLHFLDWRALLSELVLYSSAGMFYFWVLIATLSSLLVFILSASVLKKVTEQVGVDLPFWSALKINLQTFSVSMFLPSRTGDLSMVYFLKKEGVALEKAASAFFIERITYFMTIVCFAVLAVVYFFPSEYKALYVLAALIIVIPVGAYVASKLTNVVARKFFKTEISIDQDVKLVFSKPLFLVRVAVFNVVRWACRAAIFYYLFTSFSVNIPFYGIFLLISIEVFLTFIPLTLAGLGAREAFAVWAYPHFFAVNAQITFLVYVLALVIAYVEALAIIIVFGVRE